MKPLLKELKEAVEALETILTAPEHIIYAMDREIMNPSKNEVLIKLPIPEREAVEITYWKLKKIIEDI